jgi:peptide/nickel transport system substrate-binding protein
MTKTRLLGAVAMAACLCATASLAQDAPLRIVLPSEPADIDACNTTVSNIGIIIKENIVETLTTLNGETSAVQPRLATGWTDLGNGTWRVTLRDGVTFHDGAAFNADAVVKAIDRLESEAIACRDRTKIRGIDLTTAVVDDLTIDITANPPQVLMPTLLSFIGVGSPNTAVDALSRAPVGTGPMGFVSWDADGITVVASESYWGDKPAYAEAKYIFRGESALRASMVEVGEADIAVDIAPQDATNPDTDIAFLNGETTRIRMVMKPPLDDVRVRKAMNLAFDREALVGTLLSDKVLLSTQYFLPKINGYNPDLQVWAYDPDAAKALIEEARAAGVPVDQELRLIGRIGFYPNQPEVLQALQQMWGDIGLNVTVEMMESAEWLKLANKPYAEDRPAMLIQEMHDNNNGDAAFTMHFRYHSTGQQSEMALPDMDALLDKAMAATGEGRTKLFQEANRIIADEIVPAVPMYHMVSFMRVGERIAYVPNSLSGSLIELADIAPK